MQVHQGHTYDIDKVEAQVSFPIIHSTDQYCKAVYMSLNQQQEQTLSSKSAHSKGKIFIWQWWHLSLSIFDMKQEQFSHHY